MLKFSRTPGNGKFLHWSGWPWIQGHWCIIVHHLVLALVLDLGYSSMNMRMTSYEQC